MRVCRWVGIAVLVGGMLGRVAVGQREPGRSVVEMQGGEGASAVPASLTGVLRSLAGRADVVFVGQVQRIEPKDGVVEITFSVQQSVLGEVGATYVMREWAGRWTGGQQRFQLGQRAMFFLHAPSAAGLSSPVDGMAGAVPVIPMGADVEPLLDVRMLATRVLRQVGSPMVDAELGAIGLAAAAAVVSGWRVERGPEPVRIGLPVGVRPRPVEMEEERLVMGPAGAEQARGAVDAQR